MGSGRTFLRQRKTCNPQLFFEVLLPQHFPVRRTVAKSVFDSVDVVLLSSNVWTEACTISMEQQMNQTECRSFDIYFEDFFRQLHDALLLFAPSFMHIAHNYSSHRRQSFQMNTSTTLLHTNNVPYVRRRRNVWKWRGRKMVWTSRICECFGMRDPTRINPNRKKNYNYKCVNAEHASLSLLIFHTPDTIKTKRKRKIYQIENFLWSRLRICRLEHWTWIESMDDLRIVFFMRTAKAHFQDKNK